ncbi:MAG: PEP-CTERM sorting domain-containing protein [Planctomycetales bacterium]|nr:PEP-CTERM sorting domain-containing protein [Planctomycetales bacterium]
MRRTFVALGLLCLTTCVTPNARAAELLLNGDLSLPTAAAAADEPTGWTLIESGTDGSTQNTAQLIGFADHTGNTDGQGIWLREFEGLFYGSTNEMTNAVLSQTVPGTAGTAYSFSGWSRWETNYSGGVDLLDAASKSGAVASPTSTIFRMAFLDAGNNELDSQTLDLRTVQTNDNLWHQHVLTGTAPDGTASVMVTAAAYDMIPNVDPGQSGFFDDFSLMAVPEPSSCLLALLGFVGIGSLRRRR